MNLLRTVKLSPVRTAIAFLLIVCLVATASPFSGAQISEHSMAWPAELGTLSIPPELGRVSDRFTGYAGKAVVFIQDAHAHYEAQTNISKILKLISEKHRLDFVGVEGLEGAEDFSFIRSFPHAEAREKVLDEAVRKGGTTGVEYFAMTEEKPVRVVGVDDEELYIRNIQQYAELVGNHKDFDRTFSEVKQAAQNLGASVYSEKLKEMNRMMEKYDRNTTDLFSLLRALRKWAVGSKVSFEDLSSVTRIFGILDSKSEISDEDLKKEWQDVNIVDLWNEIEIFVDRLKAKFSGTAAEREMLAIDEYVKLLERGRRLELNRNEVEQFSALQNTIGGNFISTLAKLALEKRVKIATFSETTTEEVGQIASAVLEFYEIAHDRDRGFVDKLKIEMRRKNSSVAALVTGGFHSEGILKQLKKQKISYIVITPAMAEFPKENLYAKLMLDFGSVLANPVMSSAVSSARLLPMYTPLPVYQEDPSLGIDLGKMRKVWKEQHDYRRKISEKMIEAAGISDVQPWLRRFQQESGRDAVVLGGQKTAFAISVPNALRAFRYLSGSKNPDDIYAVVETGNMIPLGRGFGAQAESSKDEPLRISKDQLEEIADPQALPGSLTIKDLTVAELSLLFQQSPYEAIQDAVLEELKKKADVDSIPLLDGRIEELENELRSLEQARADWIAQNAIREDKAVDAFFMDAANPEAGKYRALRDSVRRLFRKINYIRDAISEIYIRSNLAEKEFLPPPPLDRIQRFTAPARAPFSADPVFDYKHSALHALISEGTIPDAKNFLTVGSHLYEKEGEVVEAGETVPILMIRKFDTLEDTKTHKRYFTSVYSPNDIFAMMAGYLFFDLIGLPVRESFVMKDEQGASKIVRELIENGTRFENYDVKYGHPLVFDEKWQRVLRASLLLDEIIGYTDRDETNLVVVITEKGEHVPLFVDMKFSFGLPKYSVPGTESGIQYDFSKYVGAGGAGKLPEGFAFNKYQSAATREDLAWMTKRLEPITDKHIDQIVDYVSSVVKNHTFDVKALKAEWKNSFRKAKEIYGRAGFSAGNTPQDISTRGFWLEKLRNSEGLKGVFVEDMALSPSLELIKDSGQPLILVDKNAPEIFYKTAADPPLQNWLRLYNANALKEAEVLVALNKLGIVGIPTVLAVGQDKEGFIVIQMKGIPHGREFSEETIHAFQFDPVDFFNVLIAAARTYAEMHRHGWAHRDVKGKNIVVNAAKEVMAIDFGASSKISRQAADIDGLILAANDLFTRAFGDGPFGADAGPSGLANLKATIAKQLEAGDNSKGMEMLVTELTKIRDYFSVKRESGFGAIEVQHGERGEGERHFKPAIDLVGEVKDTFHGQLKEAFQGGAFRGYTVLELVDTDGDIGFYLDFENGMLVVDSKEKISTENKWDRKDLPLLLGDKPIYKFARPGALFSYDDVFVRISKTEHVPILKFIDQTITHTSALSAEAKVLYRNHIKSLRSVFDSMETEMALEEKNGMARSVVIEPYERRVKFEFYKGDRGLGLETETTVDVPEESEGQVRVHTHPEESLLSPVDVEDWAGQGPLGVSTKIADNIFHTGFFYPKHKEARQAALKQWNELGDDAWYDRTIPEEYFYMRDVILREVDEENVDDEKVIQKLKWSIESFHREAHDRFTKLLVLEWQGQNLQADTKELEDLAAHLFEDVVLRLTVDTGDEMRFARRMSRDIAAATVASVAIDRLVIMRRLKTQTSVVGALNELKKHMASEETLRETARRAAQHARQADPRLRAPESYERLMMQLVSESARDEIRMIDYLLDTIAAGAQTDREVYNWYFAARLFSSQFLLGRAKQLLRISSYEDRVKVALARFDKDILDDVSVMRPRYEPPVVVEEESAETIGDLKNRLLNALEEIKGHAENVRVVREGEPRTEAIEILYGEDADPKTIEKTSLEAVGSHLIEIHGDILPQLKPNDYEARILRKAEDWVGWHLLGRIQPEEAWQRHVQNIVGLGFKNAAVILLGMMGPHLRQLSDPADYAVYPLLMSVLLPELKSAGEKYKNEPDSKRKKVLKNRAELLAAVLFNALHVNPHHVFSLHIAKEMDEAGRPFNIEMYDQFFQGLMDALEFQYGIDDPRKIIAETVDAFPELLLSDDGSIPLYLQFSDREPRYAEQTGQDIVKLFAEFLEKKSRSGAIKPFPSIWHLLRGSDPVVEEFLRERNHIIPKSQLDFLTAVRARLLSGRLFEQQPLHEEGTKPETESLVKPRPMSKEFQNMTYELEDDNLFQASLLINEILERIKEEFRSPEQLKNRGLNDFAHFLGMKEIVSPAFREYRKAQPIIHFPVELWGAAQKRRQASGPQGIPPPPETSVYSAYIPGISAPALYYDPASIENLAKDKGVRLSFVDFLREYLSARFYDLDLMDEYSDATFRISQGFYFHKKIMDAEMEFLKWLGGDQVEIYQKNKEIELQDKKPYGYARRLRDPSPAELNVFEDMWGGIITKLKAMLEPAAARDPMAELAADAGLDLDDEFDFDEETDLSQFMEGLPFDAEDIGLVVRPSSVRQPEQEGELFAHFDMWARFQKFKRKDLKYIHSAIADSGVEGSIAGHLETEFKPGRMYVGKMPSGKPNEFVSAVLFATAKVGSVYHFLILYPNGDLSEYQAIKFSEWSAIRVMEPEEIEANLRKDNIGDNRAFIAVRAAMRILKNPSPPGIPPRFGNDSAGFGASREINMGRSQIRSGGQRIFTFLMLAGFSYVLLALWGIPVLTFGNLIRFVLFGESTSFWPEGSFLYRTAIAQGVGTIATLAVGGIALFFYTRSQRKRNDLLIKKASFPSFDQFQQQMSKQSVDSGILAKWFIESATLQELFHRFQSAKLIPAHLIFNQEAFNAFAWRVWRTPVFKQNKNVLTFFQRSPIADQFGLRGYVVEMGGKKFHVIGMTHGIAQIVLGVRNVRALANFLRSKGIPLYSEERFQKFYGFSYGTELNDIQFSGLVTRPTFSRAQFLWIGFTPLLFIAVFGLRVLHIFLPHHIFADWVLKNAMPDYIKTIGDLRAHRGDSTGAYMALNVLRDRSSSEDVVLLSGASHIWSALGNLNRYKAAGFPVAPPIARSPIVLKTRLQFDDSSGFGTAVDIWEAPQPDLKLIEWVHRRLFNDFNQAAKSELRDLSALEHAGGRLHRAEDKKDWASVMQNVRQRTQLLPDTDRKDKAYEVFIDILNILNEEWFAPRGLYLSFLITKPTETIYSLSQLLALYRIEERRIFRLNDWPISVYLLRPLILPGEDPYAAEVQSGRIRFNLNKIEGRAQDYLRKAGDLRSEVEFDLDWLFTQKKVSNLDVLKSLYRRLLDDSRYLGPKKLEQALMEAALAEEIRHLSDTLRVAKRAGRTLIFLSEFQDGFMSTLVRPESVLRNIFEVWLSQTQEQELDNIKTIFAATIVELSGQLSRGALVADPVLTLTTWLGYIYAGVDRSNKAHEQYSWAARFAIYLLAHELGIVTEELAAENIFRFPPDQYGSLVLKITRYSDAKIRLAIKNIFEREFTSAIDEAPFPTIDGSGHLNPRPEYAEGFAPLEAGFGFVDDSRRHIYQRMSDAYQKGPVDYRYWQGTRRPSEATWRVLRTQYDTMRQNIIEHVNKSNFDDGRFKVTAAEDWADIFGIISPSAIRLFVTTDAPPPSIPINAPRGGAEVVGWVDAVVASTTAHGVPIVLITNVTPRDDYRELNNWHMAAENALARATEASGIRYLLKFSETTVSNVFKQRPHRLIRMGRPDAIHSFYGNHSLFQPQPETWGVSFPTNGYDINAEFWVKNINGAAGFGAISNAVDEELLKELGFELFDAAGGRIKHSSDFKPLKFDFDFRIVPHGVTDTNAQNLFQGGASDGPMNELNEDGKRQAQAGAVMLWNEIGADLLARRDVVFLKTPLKRTKQTADYFVKYANERGVRIELADEPAAVEMYLDKWNTPADADAYMNFNALVRPVSGESYLRFLKRVKEFVEYMNQKYKGKTVVLYGHRTFATALKILLESQESEFTQPFVRWRDIVPNSVRGEPIHFLRSGYEALRGQVSPILDHKNARTGQPKGYRKRANVPAEKVPRKVPFDDYDPLNYEDPELNSRDYADPEDPLAVKDKIKSFEGEIEFDDQNRPLNPIGRTGLTGRGMLGKWGANEAVDALITRHNPRTGQLETLGILRIDARKVALPGGFRKKGETIEEALARELEEETGVKIDMRKAKEIYRGYVDDWRNTDNAWVETTVRHYHLSAQEAEKIELTASQEEAVVAWWFPVEANVDQFYASHGDILKRFLKLTRLRSVSKEAASKEYASPSPVVLKFSGKLNFQAKTYEEYIRRLNTKERLEFEVEFMEDFAHAVRDYEQSGEWRNHHSLLTEAMVRDFILRDESLTGPDGALSRNGFFQSEEFFMNRLVKRYLLSRVLVGNGAGQMAGVHLNSNAAAGTGEFKAQFRAKVLIRDVSHAVYENFLRGKVKVEGLTFNKWGKRFLKFNTFLSSTVLEETIMMIVFPLMFAVFILFLADIIGLREFVRATRQDAPVDLMELFLTVVVVRILFKPVFKWMDKSVEKLEKKYYAAVLQRYLLSMTPEREKRDLKQYEFYFEEMRKKLLLPSSGFLKRRLDGSLLSKVQRIVHKGLRDQDRYLRAGKAGYDLTVSDLPVDARTVTAVMLKELADQNPPYFNRVQKKWQRRRIFTRLSGTLSDLVPLVRLQQNEGYLKIRSEQLADTALRARAARQIDEYGRESELMVQRTLLRTTERSAFDADYIDYLFKEMTDSVASSADRRLVILSYFMGGGLTRLKSLSESLKRSEIINRDYMNRLNLLARTHWVQFFERIRQNPEFYGLRAEEVEQLIKILHASRIKSVSEILKEEVIRQVPPQVFRGMTNEAEEIVMRKSVPDSAGNVLIDSADLAGAEDRPYHDLFSSVVKANTAFFEELASIFHETYLEGSRGRADSESASPELYQRSPKIDARLFDRTYNSVTAPVLIDMLAQKDFRGKPLSEVAIFLGNLFESGFKADAEGSRKSKLTFFHMEAVQRYLAGEISREALRTTIFRFYTLGKKVRTSEELHLDLTKVATQTEQEDGIIEAELKKVDRIKSLNEKLRSAQDDLEIKRMKAEIEWTKENLLVVVNPLGVPWTYLMEQAPRFGKDSEARKNWLISLQETVVDVVGLLHDETLFDEVNNVPADFLRLFGEDLSEADRQAILRLRKLLRYHEAMWDLDLIRAAGATRTSFPNRTYDWLAGQERHLEISWMVLSRIIRELGLDGHGRFKDLLRVGDEAMKKQIARMHGHGTLSDIIRTTPVAAAPRGFGIHKPDPALDKATDYLRGQFSILGNDFVSAVAKQGSLLAIGTKKLTFEAGDGGDLESGPPRVYLFRFTKTGTDKTDKMELIAELGTGARHANHEEKITHLVFSPDSRFLASLDENGTAIVWHLRQPERTSGQFVYVPSLSTGALTIKKITFEKYSNGIRITGRHDRKIIFRHQVEGGPSASFSNTAQVLKTMIENRKEILKKIGPQKATPDELRRFRDTLKVHDGFEDVFLPLFIASENDGYRTGQFSMGALRLMDDYIKYPQNFNSLDKTASIIFDYHLFYLLTLLSLRIWDEGDTEKNIHLIQSLLDELQSGKDASGKHFASNAETLLVWATSLDSEDANPYRLLLDRVSHFDQVRQRRFSMANVKNTASHLRSLIVTNHIHPPLPLDNNTWKTFSESEAANRHRTANDVDYEIIVRSINMLFARYEELVKGNPTDPERLEIAEAILDGLSADTEYFIVSPDELRKFVHPSAKQAVEEFLSHLKKNAGQLLKDFRYFDPSRHRYSPLGQIKDVGLTLFNLYQDILFSLVSSEFPQFNYEDRFSVSTSSEIDAQKRKWVLSFDERLRTLDPDFYDLPTLRGRYSYDLASLVYHLTIDGLEKLNRAGFGAALQKESFDHPEILAQREKAKAPLQRAAERLKAKTYLEIAEFIKIGYNMSVFWNASARHITPLHKAAYVTDFMSEIMLGEGETDPTLLKRGMAAAVFQDIGIVRGIKWKMRKADLDAKIKTEAAAIDASAPDRDKQLRDIISRNVRKAIDSRRDHMVSGEKVAKLAMRLYNEGEPGFFSEDDMDAIGRLIETHDNPSLQAFEFLRQEYLKQYGAPFRQSQRTKSWLFKPEDKLAMYLREADRLWMLTEDGIDVDFAEDYKRGIVKSPKETAARNVRRHREEMELYQAVLGADAGKYGFKNGLLFRTQTGYKIFERLAQTLIDKYQSTGEKALSEELAKLPEGFPRRSGFGIEKTPARGSQKLGDRVIAELVERDIVGALGSFKDRAGFGAEVLNRAGIRADDLPALIQAEKARILNRIEALDLNTLVISSDQFEAWKDETALLLQSMNHPELRPYIIGKFSQVLGLFGDALPADSKKMTDELRALLKIPGHRTVVVSDYSANLEQLHLKKAIPLKLDVTRILLVGEMPPNLEIALGANAYSVAAAELNSLLDRFMQLESIAKSFAVAA